LPQILITYLYLIQLH